MAGKQPSWKPMKPTSWNYGKMVSGAAKMMGAGKKAASKRPSEAIGGKQIPRRKMR